MLKVIWCVLFHRKLRCYVNEDGKWPWHCARCIPAKDEAEHRELHSDIKMLMVAEAAQELADRLRD